MRKSWLKKVFTFSHRFRVDMWSVNTYSGIGKKCCGRGVEREEALKDKQRGKIERKERKTENGEEMKLKE